MLNRKAAFLNKRPTLYDVHQAGVYLREERAVEQAAEMKLFQDELSAYVAETDALRRAGRPLSERRLPPPLRDSYERHGRNWVATIAIKGSTVLGWLGVIGLASFLLWWAVAIYMIIN